MGSRKNLDSTNRDTNMRFETGIGPITDKVLNTVLDRLKNSDFKEKLTYVVVDPITDMISVKIRPYLYLGAVLYLIVIILLVIIIYQMSSKKGFLKK